MCRAIADPDPATGQRRGETLRILVLDEAGAAAAKEALDGLEPEVFVSAFGDVWLRDTGPIFGYGGDGRLGAACFRFNGWGGRYRLPGDDAVAQFIVRASGVDQAHHDLVLEGGAVEFDGEGTVLTTRSCLLNPNRNPSLTEAEVNDRLKAAFAVDRVIWLSQGLRNDHTDGHIDTLARFVTPGKVVCMAPSGDNDPNAEVLEVLRSELEASVDAHGRPLEVVTIPSPGHVADADGTVLPASYVNFYIANSSVVVPIYGTPYDEDAVATLGELFADRRVIGVSARQLLEGGGAFHCITQQQPLGDSDVP